jgi:hypothetical protein
MFFAPMQVVEERLGYDIALFRAIQRCGPISASARRAA